MSKPLPKSLHTVTAVAKVAGFIREVGHPASAQPTNEVAVRLALRVLGYDPSNDPYCLAAAALKQMGV